MVNDRKEPTNQEIMDAITKSGKRSDGITIIILAIDLVIAGGGLVVNYKHPERLPWIGLGLIILGIVEFIIALCKYHIWNYK
ncbi:MAG: hypothetical protein ABR958_09450 [Dehalococcoidales bacterium]|jgi:hypothetical protein